MLSKKSNQLPEIPALTGLRFLAAFFVFLSHAIPRLIPISAPLSFCYLTTSRLSAEGMTLFFVLSGFVIHYNYSSSIIKAPVSGVYYFFVARFARLYPLFLLCLILSLAARYARHQFSFHLVEALPYYLSMTQSWFYIPMGDNALIYQIGTIPSLAWSISTEWFFYLMYPFVCFFLLKFTKICTRLCMLVLLSIIIISYVASITFYMSPMNEWAVQTFGPVADVTTHNQDSFFRWLIYFSPYSRISEFLVGCVTAAIYMQLLSIAVSKREQYIGTFVQIAAIAIIIYLFYIIFNPPSYLPWLPSLHQCFGFSIPSAILIFCCARYQSFISQIIANPLFLFGGEISYSIYLFHSSIIGLFAKYGKLADTWLLFFRGVMLLLVTLVAIFIVAGISYRLVEMPARRYVRRKLSIKPKGLAEVRT